MKINKTQLATLIAQQTGSEFSEDMLDDSLLENLLIEEEEEEEIETTEEDEQEEETEEQEEEDEDEEEEISLEDIDVNSLSPTEKIFYDVIMSERKKAKQREISALITNANISIKHRLVLDRMAKSGVSVADIKKTIEDFKEIEASASRTTSRSVIVSKSKVKKQTGTKAKDNIKPGTKAFGEYLAKLKHNKLGGKK